MTRPGNEGRNEDGIQKIHTAGDCETIDRLLLIYLRELKPPRKFTSPPDIKPPKLHPKFQFFSFFATLFESKFKFSNHRKHLFQLLTSFSKFLSASHSPKSARKERERQGEKWFVVKPRSIDFDRRKKRRITMTLLRLLNFQLDFSVNIKCDKSLAGILIYQYQWYTE